MWQHLLSKVLGPEEGALQSSGTVSTPDILCPDLAALCPSPSQQPGALSEELEIGKHQPVLLGCWDAKLSLWLQLLIGKKRNDVKPSG